MVFIFSEGGEVIKLDGDTKQNHRADASISSFPLEDGSFTSDHTIKKPKSFSVSVAITENESPTTLYEQFLKLRDNRELLSILHSYNHIMVKWK